jgi:hypothetical protein
MIRMKKYITRKPTLLTNGEWLFIIGFMANFDETMYTGIVCLFAVGVVFFDCFCSIKVDILPSLVFQVYRNILVISKLRVLIRFS